jgi:ABC-type antimicrobial peptide transport system permease subunit
MVIPQSAIRTASPREKVLFGTSFVLDPAYARAAGLTSAVPAGLVVIVKTGKVEDQTDAIRESLIASLTDFALRSGIPKEGVVVVSRADSGEAVRAASSGIKLVYSLIGWGVLLVSGLGLLVAELIVLRDRTWFFGLTRALGARRQDVAWLVLCDIALVLVVGFGLAVLLALATEGAVSQFGEAAFQVDLQILQPSMLPGLLAAFLSMLCLAGGYPAWRATRLDPLEVLERR